MGKKNKIISFCQKNRKTIFLILRITISASLIAFLIKTQFKDFGVALEILKLSHKGLLLLSFSTHIAGVWITAERWKILLRVQNIRLGVGSLLTTVLIGFFFNNFLPTSIGGDVFRTYECAKKAKIPIEKSASVILVERFSGVVSAATYAIVALFLGFTAIGEQSVIIPIVIFFVISLIIGFFLINPSIFKLDRLVEKIGFLKRIREKLSNIYHTLRSFKKSKIVLVKALLYSFLLQFMVILNYFLAARALGIELEFIAFIFIVPVVTMIAMLPISIGGIGLRENLLVFILVAMGVINEKAALLSLILFAMLVIVGIIGGITYIIRPFFNSSNKVKSIIDDGSPETNKEMDRDNTELKESE